MKLTALAVLFAVTILLTGTIFTSVSTQYTEAVKGQGVSSSQYGSQTKGTVCGDRLCSEIPGGREAWERQQITPSAVIPKYGMEQKGLPLSPETVHEKRSQGITCQCGPDGCNCPGCTCSQDGICTCHGDAHQCSCGGHDGKHGACASCGMSGHGYHGMSGHEMKSVTGTIQSETDPGMGHKEHQLAVLLPPSNKMYKGILTYSASTDVQLVALHGPLDKDEVMDQTIWTPDNEKTNYALTVVNPESNMGTWVFAGNALAVHSFEKEPFDVTYSLYYAKIADGHAMYGTCQCAKDALVIKTDLASAQVKLDHVCADQTALVEIL